MEHSSSAVGGTPVDGLSTNPRQSFGWLPGAWKIMIGILVVGLLGLAAFFVLHKPNPPATVVTSESPRESKPPRPAFTPAEEEYIRVLGPIHADVERITLRLTLGQIFYVNRDMDKAELKGRLDEATVAYQRTEKRILALRPPTSLQATHNEYLAAVRLLQSSTAEVRKMFQDGREEDHLHAAYPLAQEGTDKVREIGYLFWPGEHPAH